MTEEPEARIGSLSWWAGVWWLGWSYMLCGAVRAVLVLHLPYWLAWRALSGCQACSRLAIQCAQEARKV